MSDTDTLIDKRCEEIERGIKKYLPDETGYHNTVLEAINYSVLAGGKRLRPMMMQSVYKMYGGDDDKLIYPFMAAIEMIHTYSLIHDDLPAMDDDKLRRGKPTTHVKYGEAMAILAGDALLNMAYETAILAAKTGEYEKVINALDILSEKGGVRGMVAGQVVDVLMEGHFPDEDVLRFVYINKTSALIQASLMIGAILAGSHKSDIKSLETAGEHIGIAFQIKDDILDETGNEKKLGKPLHSDVKNDKSTYIRYHGMDNSVKAVDEHTHTAIQIFKDLNVYDDGEKEFLISLIRWLISREK